MTLNYTIYPTSEVIGQDYRPSPDQEQKIFERVVQGLLRQGTTASTSTGGSCSYKKQSDDGLCTYYCAIGILLQALPTEHIEGQVIRWSLSVAHAVETELRERLTDRSIRLLAALQHAHDHELSKYAADRAAFTQALIEVATHIGGVFDLTVQFKLEEKSDATQA